MSADIRFWSDQEMEEWYQAQRERAGRELWPTTDSNEYILTWCKWTYSRCRLAVRGYLPPYQIPERSL